MVWHCNRSTAAVPEDAFDQTVTEVLSGDLHNDCEPKTTRIPCALAQSPATPLQERAILVNGDQRRHRRLGARHLSRSRRGRHVTDREEPARYDWTMTGSPMATVLKYQSALSGLRLMQPWLTLS